MVTKNPSHEGSGPWANLVKQALADQPNDSELQEAIRLLQRALETTDDRAGQWLHGLGAARRGAAANGPAPPEYLALVARLLRRAFALPRFGPPPPSQLTPLEGYLAKRSLDSLRPIVGPALRLIIGKPRDEDVRVLEEWLSQFIKETSMPTPEKFYIDTSSIPILQNPSPNGGDTILQRYLTRIEDELRNRFGVPPDKSGPTKIPTAAAVMGMVVLDGEVDPNSSGLPDALRRAWLESIGDIPSLIVDHKGKVALSVVYGAIADALGALNGSTGTVAVQQLAFVAREVIAGAASIPFGHPNFASAIRIALDKYVATRATGDTLTLPPGSLPGGTQNAGGDADLNSDNIRVCGLGYSLALLEKTQILRVADRLAELFMNGLLPFGHDSAGKALDEYYWDTEDRLSETQRRSHYSRMLGMPGGEVSREVAPNKPFEPLLLRFIAVVSEHTRQREVDRMFTNRTSVMAMTGEQVRKCAFELAKNASLYAWGGSFYVATRINKHLERAIAILNQPQVLKTYAGSNHWQVVERVAQQDFGGAPNWVKFSTMAHAASKIFDILARNTIVLSSTGSGLPFLYDPSFLPNGADALRNSDISPEDTRELMTAVQMWLAVNGVRDEQVKQYAEPVELTTAPSLPGLPGADGAGMDVVNKLKQLTANGTPSPDQLQQLLAQLH